MIKAVFFDLDGTLLNEDQQVPLENEEAIKDLIDRGLDVYLATGRPHFFAETLASRIHPQLNVISADGAVYEVEDELVVHTLPREALEQIVEYVSDKPIEIYFKSLNRVYNKRYPSSYGPNYLDEESLKDFDDLMVIVSNDLSIVLDDDEITKAFVLVEDSSQIAGLREHLKQAAFCEIKETHPDGIHANIMPFGISKATAIQEIAELKGYSPDELMAFGDSENDITMLMEVGHSVAMSNGVKELKEIARYRTQVSNQEAGVAQFIRSNFELFES